MHLQEGVNHYKIKSQNVKVTVIGNASMPFGCTPKPKKINVGRREKEEEVTCKKLK